MSHPARARGGGAAIYTERKKERKSRGERGLNQILYTILDNSNKK